MRRAVPQARGALRRLTIAVDDPAALEIVRRQLDRDAVARIDPDAVTPHFPGGVAESRVSVVELNLEETVSEGLDDLSLKLDLVFLLSDSGPPRS